MSAVQYSLGLGSYFFKPCRIFQQVLHYLLGNVDFVFVGNNIFYKGIDVFQFFEQAIGVVLAVGIIPSHHAGFAASAEHACFSEAIVFAAGLLGVDGGISHSTIKIA